MRLPDSMYMNNCKIFQEIYKNHFQWDKVNDVNVGGKGKEMICSFELRYLGETSKHQQSFSYYDAVVSDAVYTIYRSGYSKFTLTDILRVMAMDEKIRFLASKDRIQAREQRLRDSMNRLKNTFISIDYSEEAEKRGLKDESGTILEEPIGDYMIPVASHKDGKTFYFIEDRELPLYQYAEMIRQVIGVKKEFLNPGELVKKILPDGDEKERVLKNLKASNTDEMVMLKHILIHRLEMMRNKNNLVKNRGTILYYGVKSSDGILPLLGIHKDSYAQNLEIISDRGKVRTESTGWKNKVNNVNKRVVAILEAYQSCGYIGSYQVLRQDPRALARGVEILGGVHMLEIK